MPVNDRLETLGRVWVRSNEDWLRRAGVLALSQFKSETNVGILKGMLADGAWWRETKSDDGGQMKQERVYYIREAAYKTLQEWKVAIPMPVLREPLKEKQSVYFEHHIRR